MFLPTGHSYGKEQVKALSSFQHGLTNWKELCVQDVPREVVKFCTDGSLYCLDHVISNSFLPRQKEWAWNQSRKRHQIVDESSKIEVIFYKITARRTNSIPKTFILPDWKLWVFTFTTQISLERIDSGIRPLNPFPPTGSVVWVERGNIVSKTMIGKRYFYHNHFGTSQPIFKGDPKQWKSAGSGFPPVAPNLPIISKDQYIVPNYIIQEAVAPTKPPVTNVMQPLAISQQDRLSLFQQYGEFSSPLESSVPLGETKENGHRPQAHLFQVHGNNFFCWY